MNTETARGGSVVDVGVDPVFMVVVLVVVEYSCVDGSDGGMAISISWGSTPHCGRGRKDYRIDKNGVEMVLGAA
jgi:hypothetical protein